MKILLDSYSLPLFLGTLIACAAFFALPLKSPRLVLLRLPGCYLLGGLWPACQQRKPHRPRTARACNKHAAPHCPAFLRYFHRFSPPSAQSCGKAPAPAARRLFPGHEPLSHGLFLSHQRLAAQLAHSFPPRNRRAPHLDLGPPAGDCLEGKSSPPPRFQLGLPMLSRPLCGLAPQPYYFFMKTLDLSF